METVIVLALALSLFVAVVLALRRHRRLFRRGIEPDDPDQRAESWLTKGGGRG